MRKHKHRTLRKRKINRKKKVTIKHRPLKYKKHYRGGSPNSSPSSSSLSNYGIKGMYSRLKNSLGITPYNISLNKIVKAVLKDIPKENHEQFIRTLKLNLTTWIKELGNNNSTKDLSTNTDHTTTDDTNIDDTNTDDTNTDDTNTDNANTDNANIDHTNTDDTNPDHANTNLDYSNSNLQSGILPEQIISNS